MDKKELDTVTIKAVPMFPTEPYKCKKGHEFEVGGLTNLTFSVYYGVGSKHLGTTNYLCPQCVLDFANENFTLYKVK